MANMAILFGTLFAWRRESGLLVACLTKASNMIFQFLFRSPALKEEADHFVGAFGWLLADSRADEKAGDKRNVHLDRHSV